MFHSSIIEEIIFVSKMKERRQTTVIEVCEIRIMRTFLRF